MNYAELFRDFLDDAEAHIKAFEENLLSLEQDGHNRDVIVHALGSLHTLKGNSGMMGLESLKVYLHETEEVLKKCQESNTEMESELDRLFDCAHVIRRVLQDIAVNPESCPDLTEALNNLRQRKEESVPEPVRQTASDLSSYLGAKTDTIKVDFKRLDALLNLVGELVIFKTRLNQMGVDLRGEIRNKPLLKDFDDGLELVGKTISGLQEGIMRVRMLPVRQVFTKFTRMVRDLSKRQGKEIRLVFSGEDTELDKTVIDEMEEPLLHLIRNAIDHGIELPRERVMKGKDRQGTISLTASQESNYVIIRVKDDGIGINSDAVLDAARQKGLIGDDIPESEAVLSLIFRPGFTTKQEASDVSGRGIGLDVVCRNIIRLNGQISAESIPDSGSTFTIKLPLSLAIIPALMAESAGEIYAIPMSAVDESIKVREADIHLINNHEVVQFREKVIPVIRLSEFFRLSGEKKKWLYLIILGKSDRRIAIAVDRLRGQQDIVIKPLDDALGKSPGIAGASILGDGRIVLIVDVASFWKTKTVKTLEHVA